MNGDEFTEIMVQLKELGMAYKGLKELLTEKFKPVDAHLKEGASFRDKVVRNCNSIFWLRIILIPIFLGIMLACWRVLAK